MSPRCTLTLRLLRQAGPRGVTIGEFLDAGVGTRYGARLEELRKAGYVIETRRQGAGSLYTLVSEPVGRGDGGRQAPEEPTVPVASPSEPTALFTLDAPRTGSSHYDAAA